MKKKRRRLSDAAFEAKLARLIERRIEGAGGMVTTFRDAGVLTNNRGLVVHLPGGQEFQLTIIDSTRY